MPAISADDHAISAAVRQLMAFTGETPTEIAYHCGISTASIYRKLNGEAKWMGRDVGALARHWNVSPGDLYDGVRVVNPLLPAQQRSRRASDRRRGRLTGHQPTSRVA